ncbi:MAG: hypothetical protein PVJ05_01735 [Candidatus Thorarchaeota archaeon]
MRTKTRKLVRIGKGPVLILIVLLTATVPMASFSYENIALSITSINQYLHSAEIPHLNLTYTTRTNLTPTPIESGDSIAGDHLTLKAEWTSQDVNRSRLEVFAPAIPAFLVIEDNHTELEIDTRALGNNATCTITSTAWLKNGSVLISEITDVYIGNYFVPKVVVLTPNGNETWESVHNITWSGSDQNADDILLYDVLYSSDSGTSFETLISSTNLTWYEWDCSNLVLTDTYLVEVRIRDGIYFSSDRSDSLFTAGTIVPTSTPTSPTPTTTPTGLEFRIILFVAILLFSSGVMALVVYYAARKWV